MILPLQRYEGEYLCQRKNGYGSTCPKCAATITKSKRSIIPSLFMSAFEFVIGGGGLPNSVAIITISNMSTEPSAFKSPTMAIVTTPLVYVLSTVSVSSGRGEA